MARLSRFGLAAITSITVALLVTYGSYSLGLWAGGHGSGWYTFTLRSLVLLPVVLGFFAAMWPLSKLKPKPLVAGTAGMALGIAYCYFATRLMFWMTFRRWGGFGHSIFTYPISWDGDIEALVCGTVIGACAMLVAVAYRGRAMFLSLVVLLIIGVFAPRPAFNLITHNQELTVAVVTPQGTNTTPELPEVTEIPRRFPPVNVGNVTSRVLQSLRDAGVAGKYQVVDLYRQGQGKQVFVIIVISKPVTDRTDLPEPRGADVIYLQGPEGWKTIPSQVRTLDRAILIWPEPEEGHLGSVMIADASGIGSGFWIPKNFP